MSNPAIHIVLVRPIYASNVGFCARACANLGATSLIVVAPQCDLEDLDAKRRAAGAQETFHNKVVYKTWEEFYQNAGQGLRIGFTRRCGKNRPVPLYNELLPHIQKEQSFSEFENIYLFLGPEDDGLDAKDLEFMNVLAQLPVYGPMGSYNLGHAAILSLYILQNFLGTEAIKEGGVKETEIYHFKGLEYNDASLREWLILLGQDISHPTKSVANILNNMILRAIPTSKEIEVWDKILNNTIRLLKKLKPEDRWQKLPSNYKKLLE